MPSSNLRVRRAGARSDGRAIGYVPYKKEELPYPLPATLVAFYLPQFHPIPENDEWWGKGFTEWRNVSRALPQFEGHAQPRLPGDLGFYDLRNPEVMREQALLAREYGISAFCFYFYWFGGKTLLETPLRNWLADPTIDFPFCLCWANEKWTRTWDGRGEEILIDQQHGVDDDIAFIKYVADYLRDPRYLRIGGKPVLLVYRPGLLPDAKATAGRWRAWCIEHGIGELHLVYVQSFDRVDPSVFGLDAAVEFPPNLSNPDALTSSARLLNPTYTGQVMDWRAIATQLRQSPRPDYTLYKGVNPGWDNEARRPGKGRSYIHASPRAYGEWLEHSIDHSLTSPNPVFINAWNEWAEGAVLEPDARFGYAYLDATRKTLARVSGASKIKTNAAPTAIIHAWYREEFDEILQELIATGIGWRVVVTTRDVHVQAIKQRLAESRLPHEVLALENRGRDILPFLMLASKLMDEGVDVVLKLHTKRTTHRKDGDLWRKELVQLLIGGSRASAILEAFSERPDLGMVGPEGHIQLVSRFAGSNADNLDYLAARMGIPNMEMDTDRFVAGSMFWIRLNALRPILDAGLDEWEFEDEANQIDGTFAHAVERVLCRSVQAAGFLTASAASVMGLDEPPSTEYRYAKPD